MKVHEFLIPKIHQANFINTLESLNIEKYSIHPAGNISIINAFIPSIDKLGALIVIEKSLNLLIK